MIKYNQVVFILFIRIYIKNILDEYTDIFFYIPTMFTTYGIFRAIYIYFFLKKKTRFLHPLRSVSHKFIIYLYI